MLWMSWKNRCLPEGREFVGIFFALAGVFLIATHGSLDSVVLSPAALTIGIISAISLAFYTVMPFRLLQKYSTTLIIGWGQFLSGGFLCIFINPFEPSGHWDGAAVAAMVYLILGATVLSYSVFLVGLKVVGATKASLISCAEPLASIIAVVLWLKTPLTLEDLVGKHISVGAAGSTTVDEATVHLSLLGKTLDDLKAEYMGTSESADAISNKQLDGVWVMAGTPNAAVTQIMTTTDAKILPIPAETVEALKVNYPWYASYTIPAGTYAGQDEDVPTSAVKLTLFITADVDEETVYQMTKTFWENWDMLTETHAALKKASLEEACTDLAGVPIHEGAARYYREVGGLE